MNPPIPFTVLIESRARPGHQPPAAWMKIGAALLLWIGLLAGMPAAEVVLVES